MSSLKPTRALNPNNYQLLQIATFLLYFTAASALLSHLGVFGAPTPYFYLGFKLGGGAVFARGSTIFLGSGVALANLFEIAAIIGMAYAGAMIASGRKLGWQLGVVLAGGQVAIPILLFGARIIATSYAITWLFDIALLVTLVHPVSRQYEKTWYD